MSNVITPDKQLLKICAMQVYFVCAPDITHLYRKMIEGGEKCHKSK